MTQGKWDDGSLETNTMGTNPMNKSLVLGHDKIDSDHENIFALIEHLSTTMKTGKDKQTCSGVLGELLACTMTHFAMEEELMIHHDQHQARLHKDEHDTFLRRINDFRNKLETNTVAASIEILVILLEWWTLHIQSTDKVLVGALDRIVGSLPVTRPTISNSAPWALGNRINVKA
jgi:hemerythrin